MSPAALYSAAGNLMVRKTGAIKCSFAAADSTRASTLSSGGAAPAPLLHAPRVQCLDTLCWRMLRVEKRRPRGGRGEATDGSAQEVDCGCGGMTRRAPRRSGGEKKRDPRRGGVLEV